MRLLVDKFKKTFHTERFIAKKKQQNPFPSIDTETRPTSPKTKTINFATLSLELEILNETEKRKTTEKETRFTEQALLISDLMHNSTGYVIKQLVHAVSCALSSYGALGKFGEHLRS